jgi:hypothetical protein
MVQISALYKDLQESSLVMEQYREEAGRHLAEVLNSG